ncbi:16S rRNA (uracil(1498)-N(3))-methyltransferase [bacterium]|nr:16S rRNA (uracil(1498)-N(3))-methyltransferase [bacterium]
MPHFFINSNKISNNKIVIDDKENYTHIAKSLRSKIGEKILLIDENQIQYETKIVNIEKNSLEVKIETCYPSKRFLNFNLSLAQSPLNSNSQNTIIEKATELGVNHIYPIFTDNCAVKKAVVQSKHEKWQRIMYEASKQCERAFTPTCHNITTLEKVVQGNFDRILALVERLAKENLKNYLNQNPIKPNENILVIIGPEGGFSQREFELFENNPKIEMLSLGDLILKADTAVITTIGHLVL